MERGIAESDTIVSVSEGAARPIFAVKEKATYDRTGTTTQIIADLAKICIEGAEQHPTEQALQL